MRLVRCRISAELWNGLNVFPPMMHFEKISTLGVVGREQGTLKISFALNDKSFCGDVGFHTQHLVASVSFLGGLYGDEQHTLVPPYIPELNEFYARSMHFEYDKLRIEPERVGLVIAATDVDTFVYALPVAKLVEWVIGMAGFASKLSSGGLIARQLIAQLGGLQGARAFKIPGVRRLLREQGPREWFTKNKAKQMIESKDLEDLEARFNKDHQKLYIEPRPHGTPLTSVGVFSYLVEKGLFRIGTELTCPSCRIADWIGIDRLKQRTVCELCGHEYDAARQLVNSGWQYRRSGVLGVEENAQGSIPVLLTLQQLDANFRGAMRSSAYSPSLEFTPKDGADVPKCEVDFVWIIPRGYPDKTKIILGECKDQGNIRQEDFNRDIDNLRRVADALPSRRFDTFVLLAKLSAFTPEEIETARALNDKYRRRVILLTARELEPYHFFERTKKEFKINGYGSTPEGLANATAELYFKEVQTDPGGGPQS